MIGDQLVWHIIVKIDLEDIMTDCDPERLVDERPGPETEQLFTCDAFQEICDDDPFWILAGSAEISAFGAKTCTDANAGAELPPVPEHIT
jgi:hypothetical protein